MSERTLPAGAELDGAWHARNRWLAGFGLLLGLAVGASGAGCARECTGIFTQCTTKVGLRMVDCSGLQTFNDGTTVKDFTKAFNKCFCMTTAQPCLDGRTLMVCDSEEFDGQVGGTFSDGVQEEAGAALAACVGWDTCARVDDVCDPPYYFFECTIDGTTTYLGSDGSQYTTREEAEAACRFPDASCRAVIRTCSELPDCPTYRSAACRGTSVEYLNSEDFCYDYPACHRHTSAELCDNDEACQWTG